MSKVWRPQTQEVLQSWIEALQTEASDELNEWETNFVNDMWEKLNAGHTLTRPQEEKLEKIYAENTP